MQDKYSHRIYKVLSTMYVFNCYVERERGREREREIERETYFFTCWVGGTDESSKSMVFPSTNFVAPSLLLNISTANNKEDT